MTEKIGLMPSCWGSPLWYSLNSIAFAYNPILDNRQKYYDFFENLGYILPCEECKLHYLQNFNKESLIRALDTNEGLFRWVYDLHNTVNKQLGVPEDKWPSYEKVRSTYDSFKANCSETPGVCGNKVPGTKKTKVIEQVGEYSENTRLYIIIIFLLAIIFLCIGYIYTKKNRR